MDPNDDEMQPGPRRWAAWPLPACSTLRPVKPTYNLAGTVIVQNRPSRRGAFARLQRAPF
jgi:hypothetical protein